MNFDPSSAVLASDAPKVFDPSTAAPVKPETVTTGDTLQLGPLDTGIPLNADWQNFLAGAGKGFSDTGSGIHQIALHIGNHLGLIPDSDVQQNQQQIDAAKERDRDLMQTKAGIAGNIVGSAAPMTLLPEAGIAGTLAEGAAAGAVQPVATGESRAQNAGLSAVGALAGKAVGKVVGTALQGFGVGAEKQGAVDLLTSEGIPLSVAQKTGAKLPQTVERASAMTSDEPAEFALQQGQAFNRAVLRRIGVTDPSATAATPEVLAPAKEAITNSMDGVAQRTSILVDNQLLNELGSAEQDALRQLPESNMGPIRKNLSDILTNASQNGGYLDGTFYQKLNRNLSALSAKPETAPVAGDIREAVNDALDRSANPDDVAELRMARSQYRALKQIEPAIDPATGNVSPLKLINSMSVSKNRNQALYGRGDQSLMSLARAAKQVLPDRLNNSGTAERMVGPMSAMEVAASGEPLKAAVKMGAGVAGLNAAGRAMRSQGVIGNVLTSGLGAPGQAVAPVVSGVAAPLGYGAAETERTGRASGGKVDGDKLETLVTRLISMSKQAKKATDKTTEPLLTVHDNAIAKALALAQEAI